MIRKLAALGLALGTVFGAAPARAYLVVGTDAAQTPGSDTRVLVLREPGRSVVVLSPTVRGPAKPLALVVPLQTAAVESLHTMPITLFDRTAKLTAPRLDEVWELDPCELHADRDSLPAPATAAPSVPAPGAAITDGDYEISVLTAADSQAPGKWLSDHGYKLPEGAEPALNAAAKPGTLFAVARIDASKLTFDKEQARLPPLGFVVNGDGALPLRLASLGATSAHDLVIDVLSPNARVEAANLVNLAVPTNLDAIEDAMKDPDSLHRAVLDFAIEKTPGAAITEYAWLAASCDGCAQGTAIGDSDLAALGVDRMPSAEDGSLREVMIDVPESLSRAPEGPPELRRALTACYAKTLVDMRGLAGEATVTVETGEDGAVTSAKTKDATAEVLGKCVEEAARAVKLDKPKASGSIKVRFLLIARSYLGHLVLSRLRVRAAKGTGADLELRTAAAIEGGREEGPSGAAEKKVYFSEHANNFRARYVVRHPWAGPIACQDPKRGLWGPKPKIPPAPSGKPVTPPPTASASASSSASGKPVAPTPAERALAALLEGGALPDLQPYAIAYRAAPEPPKSAPVASGSSAPSSPSATPPPSGSAAPGSGGGCGCRAEPAPVAPWSWIAISAIAAAIALVRKRNRGGQGAFLAQRSADGSREIRAQSFFAGRLLVSAARSVLRRRRACPKTINCILR